MQIAWKGLDLSTCAAGRQYRKELQLRWRQENKTLADLTGWAPADSRKAMVEDWMENRQNQTARMFFFERKNQKTFVPPQRMYPHSVTERNKSLLLLFFRKEVLILLPMRHIRFSSGSFSWGAGQGFGEGVQARIRQDPARRAV